MNWEKTGQFLTKIRFLRIAIGILIFNAIVFAMLVLPGRVRHQILERDLSTLKIQVDVASRHADDLQSRVSKLEQAQKDLKFLYDQVFESNKTGPTEIRLELEALAQRTQVKRGDFTYSYQGLPLYDLQQFDMGVPVEGTYRNIRQFINSIERSKHFLILLRVDLSAEKKRPDAVNLNFKLSTFLVSHAS